MPTAAVAVAAITAVVGNVAAVTLTPAQDAKVDVVDGCPKPPPLPMVQKSSIGRGTREPYQPTAESEKAIEEKLVARYQTQKHLRHDANTRHYVEYCEGINRDPIINDPLEIQSQRHMERYVAYESACRGLKGHTIEAKLVGVNAAHEALGLLPPFSTSPIVRSFLTELKAADDPPKYSSQA